MIRRGTLAELRARPELIEAAGLETGIKPFVQWESLGRIEESGAMLLLIVEVDARVVGWLCAWASTDLWTGVMVCTGGSAWIAREHRGRWGVPLIIRAVEASAAAGVTKFRIGAFIGSRLARLLRRLGFLIEEVVAEVVPIEFAVQYSADHGPSGIPAGGARVRHLRRGDAAAGGQQGPA